MKSRGALLLACFFAVSGAACPKKRPEPQACANACTHLAALLSEERQHNGQPVVDGLDSSTQQGQKNIENCANNCQVDANREQVECLLKTTDIANWMACGAKKDSWF